MPLATSDMVELFEIFKFEEYCITNFEIDGSAIAGRAVLLGYDAGVM